MVDLLVVAGPPVNGKRKRGGLMSYEVCKRCKKMFKKNGREYCKDCFEKNRDEYGLILKHIRKYPNATVMDIITETGVSLKTINCLVEDGDVSYVEDKIVTEDVYSDPREENRIHVKRDRFHSRRR